MKPLHWMPTVELSKLEERIVKVLKHRHLYVFLRRHRHELFDREFQTELDKMYGDDVGRLPAAPAFLAMVMLLQAYTGLSDADAVEAAQTDLKWQMVLGVLGSLERDKPPFSQGALPAFRRRMMEHEMDRRLLERTVELARTSGEFGYKNLRLALDSSPLFTASRVEDTYNLLGHAARKVLEAANAQLGRGPDEMAALALDAGIPLLAVDPAGAGGSLKARLDVAWEKPEERAKALVRLVGQIRAMEGWFRERFDLSTEPLASKWSVVEQILGQDVAPDPETGDPKLKQGVAPERRPSIEDGDARHGRKSRQQKFVGYKRHVALDLDSRLVLAVQVAPANKPEGAITPLVSKDLAHLMGVGSNELVADRIRSLHVDRAYLSSSLATQIREQGGDVVCRPYTPGRIAGRFSKSDFLLSFEAGGAGKVTCPAGISVAAVPGKTSRFPAERCCACPLQAKCTKARSGRSVTMHEDERFYQELRERQISPEGRAELRERTKVEHALSRQVSVQGRKARYRGTRKNLMATRVAAAVVNLHVHDREDREQYAAQVNAPAA